jgi:hypothetical protein
MKQIMISLASLCVLPSCSVVMAAKKEGTDVKQVQDCHTRSQFLGLGAKVISSEVLPSGDRVETYQILREKGSAARAVMHGLLDVSTFCLWEIAGTPIEGSLDKNEYITIKVTYGPDDVAKKAELL